MSQDSDKLKEALEALKDPSRSLTSEQWRALGPAMTLEAEDAKTRKLQEQARATLQAIEQREQQVFAEKQRKLNQEVVDRDTTARKKAADKKLNDAANERFSQSYAPERPPKSSPPPSGPLPPALQAIQSMRPQAPTQNVDEVSPPRFDESGYKATMARVGQEPPASQDVQPEFVSDSEPVAPAYQSPQDERISPAANALRRGRQSGAAVRMAEMTPRSPSQMDTLLSDLEGATSQDVKALREKEARIEFTRRYGQEPDAIRWTEDGEPVPTMGEERFQGLMNRLKMRRAVEEVESLRAQREGTDPESVARSRARAQQDEALRLRQSELEADERKTAAKEQAARAKEEEAYALDAAGVIPRAMSDQGSPATKAFASYVDAADSGQPTDGFDDAQLQLAEQGAAELINLYEGVGRGGLGAAGDTTQVERRNVKQFIGKYLPKLQADRKTSADRRQRAAVNSVHTQSAPSGMPELPGVFPGESFVNKPNQQATLEALMANPSAANTNPVGPGFLRQASSVLRGQGLQPSMATSQLGAIPTTHQALSTVQGLLAQNAPVGRLMTSLLAGRGSEAQRQAALQWITSTYGIDPNQLILRQSIHSDPVWMEQTRKAIQSMQATGADFK